MPHKSDDETPPRARPGDAAPGGARRRSGGGVLLLALALALVGCASHPAMLTQAVAPAAAIGTEVTCDSGCTVEWQRAQLWLANHADWKIETATDVLLQTHSPQSAQATGYSFTVTKTPATGTPGRYTIAVRVTCSNPWGDVCAEWKNQEEVRRAFLYFVATGEDLLVGVPLKGAGIHEE